MKSLEFKTVVHDGMIEIPKDVPEIKEKEVKVTLVWDDRNEKNYDVSKIEMIFSEIRNQKVFEDIKNPSAWQKDIRNDWE